MIKKTSFILLVLGILSITSCSAQNPEEKQALVVKKTTETKGKPVHINNAEFKQLVFNYDVNKQWKYEGTTPAIVDFYADWCGPCRTIAPILDVLAKEYEGKVIIYKVNTDQEKQLSQALGISSLPTLVFIPVGGAPQAILGAQPKEELVKAINSILLTKK